MIGAAAFTGTAGAIAFVVANAEGIAAFFDLPGRALRHEAQDSLLFELATAALARDSAQESRTLYYYRAMHCIHDGYEDTSEFLDCPHFREELMTMLAEAEGRAGPSEDKP